VAELLPFPEFGGLDLVSHEKIASPLRCRSCRNIQKRRSRALARRQGYKATCTNTGNNGGFGTVIYNRRSSTTGAVTKERLSIGSKLYKQTTHTFTLNYGGAGSGVAEILVDVDTETWHFKLYEDSVEVLDYDMGIGFDETTVLTVNNLITAIATTANFTATTSGGGGLPAAFLPYLAPTQVSSSIAVTFFEAAVINQPSGAADPFAGAFANRNGSEFENVSSVQIDDIILFGSKWDSQKKYDGVDVYRAGAPEPQAPSTVEAASGALANGTYSHMLTVVQVDAQGNEIEGIESLPDTVTTVGGFGINVTISNILNTTGFNTDCAIVAGAQVGVTTITVDNGSGGAHTMKVGQTAYFYDGVSAAYVQRAITAVAATTITIAGANVNVADNIVISNNLRLRLWRTVASGTIFKEHIDLPNNSFTATQVYLDVKADASLGADYVSPALDGNEHGLPPQCGYLGTFDGSVVAAGNLSSPDEFYWTSPDGPEYWPSNFSDHAQAGDNLAITGVSSGDRFFWVQKQETSFLVAGKLTTGQFTSTRKGDSAGCLAHATMVQADTSLYWLGQGGVYESKDGGTPFLISDDIHPVFENAGLSSERMLAFKRAVAVYDKHSKFYIIYIPAEESQGGEVFANEYSRIFAFDTQGRDWWEWDGLNWAGGVAHDETTGDMIWTERRYSTFNSTMAFQMYLRLNTNSPADYVDHVSDIPWSYEPAGEIDAGGPDINKKFLYIIINASDPEKIPNYRLSVKVEKDGNVGTYQTELEVVVGTGTVASDGWGFGAWGFFPWGNPISSSNIRRRLRSGFAESIRPLFEASGIYNEIVLSSFSLLVEAPYKIKIPEARGNV
jgi:hypothetical protein